MAKQLRFLWVRFLVQGPLPLSCTMNVVRDIEREVVVDHVLDLIDYNNNLLSIYGQCCGTVTIFFGSGSDLLKSYGSGSDFCQDTVPVPVPYKDHKNQLPKFFLTKIWPFTA